jgi:uncharacterized protein (TIGR03083 family)
VDTDYAAVYEDTRLRFAALARSLSDDDLARTVPATPDWTAKDLLAHVVGIAEDVSKGNVEGTGSAPWTQAQVERGRSRRVADLLEQWDELAILIAQGINFMPRTAASLFVADLVTHEHDLRGALKRPGGRDSVGVELALDAYAFRFRRRVEQAGLAPVVISDGAREWRSGEGEPAATVTGEPFELLRALTGRRTPAEVEANLTWTGDRATYLPYVSMYGTPESGLGE